MNLDSVSLDVAAMVRWPHCFGPVVRRLHTMWNHMAEGAAYLMTSRK